MLHSISWLRFGGFLFLGLVIYYGYVLIRFFGRELRDFAQWRKTHGQEPPWDTSDESTGKDPGGSDGSAGSGDRGAGSERQFGDQARTGQAEQERQAGTLAPVGKAGNVEAGEPLRSSGGAAPGGPDIQEPPDALNGMMVRTGVGADDQTPELFKVMERAIGRLRELSVDWSLTAIRREELEEEIQRILSSYGQLKRTSYQIAVNNFLVRTCKMHFATELTEEDLTRLWEG